LSPTESKRVERKGFLQICSSEINSEGARLEFVGEDIWGSLVGVDDSSGERLRCEATAKVRRLADERNLIKWMEKTEKMIKLADE